MSMRFVATALAVLLCAGPALAEECPDVVSEDSGVRRQQAKKWFTKGEDAIKSNDDLVALKAYQCSLKFVPHGFTAFNIAQIAERVGDLELAVASYNQYLLLVPDAKDMDDINRKVDGLKQRLARVKQQERAAKAPRPAVAPRPVAPAPVVASANQSATQTTTTAEVSSTESSGPSFRTYAWISYGSAAALVLGGVITNLMSRSKMDTCREKYSQDDRVAADSACSDAKPLAYTSYVLFGLGGAAAALGTFFVLRPTDSSEVAMSPLPEGGLALRWGGRF
jgi:tetratricopeptide (TPR) repeat protein